MKHLKKIFAAVSVATACSIGAYASHRLVGPSATETMTSSVVGPVARHDISQNAKNAALCYAAHNSQIEIVMGLLDDGADIHHQDDQALRSAVFKRDSVMVDALIQRGADVNALAGAPLTRAAWNGDARMVAALIEHGADVNVQQGAPLIVASMSGHAEVVAKLLQRGANTGVDEARSEAMRHGHADVAKLLTNAQAARLRSTPNRRPQL